MTGPLLQLDLRRSKHLHFLGIKGVGMTSLALYAQDMGKTVSGSDVREEFVTQEALDRRNIQIDTNLDSARFPTGTDGIVYSGVYPTNPKLGEALKQGIPTLSYGQALAKFTLEKDVIATCGVGGKSTTAAMMATILSHAKRHPSFVVGVGNIPNLRISGRFDPKGSLAVVEADEYVSVPKIDLTPKFHYLSPMVIIATNIEHDHPDVYKDLGATLGIFERFFARLPSDGLLVANIDSKNLQAALKRIAQKLRCAVMTYGYSPQADWRIQRFATGKRRTTFVVEVKGVSIEIELSVPGKFNAANATASLIAATHVGIPQREAVTALRIFKGTQRRFERVGNRGGIEFWDDYAHHPSEIQATLEAARTWFSEKRLVVIFQPHTYSRTKALLSEFSQALSHADQVIITDIFASAREKRDPSISGEILAKQTRKYLSDTQYLKKGEMVEYLKNSLTDDDVVMTLGAGDIYKVAQQLVDGS